MTLVLDYEPEGLVEKAGDALDVVERQAETDLERFKSFIESEGDATADDGIRMLSDEEIEHSAQEAAVEEQELGEAP